MATAQANPEIARFKAQRVNFPVPGQEEEQPPAAIPYAMMPTESTQEGMARIPAIDQPPPQIVGPTPQQEQIDQTQQQLKKVQFARANPWGSPENHPGKLGHIAHILSVAGNIAGNIVAPGTMSLIPGTQLNMQDQEAGLSKQLASETAQQGQDADQESQNELRRAQTEHAKAETADIPVQSEIKQRASSASLAQHGLKVATDENGGTHVVPDEESPIFKQQQVKDQTLQAQADYTRAGIELRNAQAELARSKNDPNSASYLQAQNRINVAAANQQAAKERADAYMGRYMQSAYNVGLTGGELPGAAHIANDEGALTTVGTGNAARAAQSQSMAAQFNDVHGALDTVENAADSLVREGGKLNSPGVAMALSQPKGTLGQWLQGTVAKANLNPAEREYVQAVSQAHENIQALRKAAGGIATDAQVEKLDAMVPNASTPDLNYLRGQTKQIRLTAERLGKGVTTAEGGLTVRGQQPKSAATPPDPNPQNVKPGYRRIYVEGHGWGSVPNG